MKNDAHIDSSNQPYSNCFLCGGEGVIIYNRLKDCLFDVAGEKWNFKKCVNPACGLMWLDPMPQEKDRGEIYYTYYTHNENTYKIKNNNVFTQIVRWNVQWIYSVLKRVTLIRRERKRLNLTYLDTVKAGRLLEVGCGSGNRLARIQALGWEVTGQEIDPKAAAFARSKYGLNVHVGELQVLSFPDNAFDAIIMNHVIEHVHNPVKLLTECHRIMKQGGILVAVTPNIESFGHKWFKSSWRGLEPPRHLYLFSQKTLHQIAKRAGFNKCDLWTTAAKAEVFAIGSMDIKHYGQHKMGHSSKLNVYIKGIFFQLLAKAVHIINPDSGEECVLSAVK